MVRRVVLGTDGDGRSRVTADGPAPVVHTVPGLAGYAAAEVWGTDAAPPPLEGEDPTTARTSFDVELPPGATRFRIVDFPPKDAGMPLVEHATPTLDYLVVLDGSVVLQLDDGEVELRAGDTAVQRANRHAWRNDGDQACRVAVVMISVAG